MDEIWKPVPSKVGVMASSLGRILMPERWSKMPNGSLRKYEPKPTFGFLARASKTARHEYMSIQNRFFGTMKVHRLVCEAFHGPAPDGMGVVIHIDEDATNNNAANLRWGTQRENMNMPKFIEYCKSRTGENSPSTKGKKARQ